MVLAPTAWLEQAQSRLRPLFGRYWCLWAIALGFGAAIHIGTALLRLSSLFPTPQVLDFASFYANAWAVRLDLPAYASSDELTNWLIEEAGLTTTWYAPSNGSPVWMAFIQPFTLLPFSVAAWLWLLILLLITAYSTLLLARTAGYQQQWSGLILFPFIVTMGAVFLNLTLGQNALFLLLSSLLLGLAIRQPARATWPPIAFWILAVAAKLYPLIWLAILPALRRWRLFSASLVACLAVFTMVALIWPAASQDYWFRHLPERAGRHSEQVSLENQSLRAWLFHLVQTQQISVPGLDVTQRQSQLWASPVSLSVQTINLVSATVLLVIGAGIFVLALRTSTPGDAEGMFYSAVLYSLLVFPEADRYNHVLVLPAMAWLWRQPGSYRQLVLVAYILLALARLSHVWATMPWPYGPLATRFSLYTVFLLLGGIATRIYTAESGAEQAANGQTNAGKSAA